MSKNVKSLNLLIERSIKQNWEHLALTDFNGSSFQYRDLGRKIAKQHLMYEHIGLLHFCRL